MTGFSQKEFLPQNLPTFMHFFFHKNPEAHGIISFVTIFLPPEKNKVHKTKQSARVMCKNPVCTYSSISKKANSNHEIQQSGWPGKEPSGLHTQPYSVER
jgi:hypothetical protein